MKLAFVSNILNHHQVFLCNELKKYCDEFYFIATEDVKACGYQKTIDAEYVINYFDSEKKAEVEEIIKSFDAVIFGACPNELIDLRMRENKLSFLYSERIFKKGKWRRLIPRTAKGIYNRYLKYKDKNFYILSASSFMPSDLKLIKFPTEKCFKFGYFPELKIYDDTKKIIEWKHPVSILWTARFIEWKHPEVPVRVVKRLKAKGYDVKLTMVGDGECRFKIEKLIKKYRLQDSVNFLGSMTPQEVRENMEKSEMFLFTSDKNEGWGAVVNEAMNSACAVIVSSAVGSASYLIKDGENGFIYKYGNLKDLLNKTEFLLNNEKERKEISKNAYESIDACWNYKEAAKRFLEVAESLLNGKPVPEYGYGPLSKGITGENG